MAMDNMTPLQALRWSVAMGADEAIGDEPVDRYAQSAEPAAPAQPAVPVHASASTAPAAPPLASSQGAADSRAAARLSAAP